MENKKKAVIYCRVSTKEQVEEGNSLVTQERNCREYAAKNSYEIAEVFIELGESAKTADRTELQKLFTYCANKKNNISVVISYKIDRISRNTDDYSQIRILLKRYGVEIKSTSEYFENTPAGRFMENIIANVAQFDNDVRTERSVGGMKQAVLEGRYVWMAPMGYSNAKVNGKSNIIPNQYAPEVKFIFQQIADKKMTAEEVRQYLHKKGTPISKNRFYVLIANKTYIGKINKFGQEFIGSFEPLISEGLFNLAQQALNRKYANRIYKNEHPDFPLRRFIKSPTGLYLTGCWCQGRKKKYPYYRFPMNGKMLVKDVLEESYISFLNSFAVKEEFIDILKAKITEKLRTQSSYNKDYKEHLSATEKVLKEKRQVMLNKNLNGIISDDLLKEQLEIINTELWQTQNKLYDSKDEIIDLDFIFERLHKMLINPGNYWNQQNIKTKRWLQRFEFPDGIVFDGINFQTQKICSIFKLKETFGTDLSLLADYPKHSIKHQQIANSPTSNEASLKEYLKAIENELIELDKNEKATMEWDAP